ncbi:hypothetical protein [Mucilaginibacter arboris]|uniref:Nuclear transport factor 2 family protein n=1 Tax=Mucilaginibacter arboris TaxID=2682090 RepID=A0A7K1SV62_9SPHI|nr:hypothetical protein [Mucilaginibacter arboris]MVN21174.1 hypothetical protein [Mucilaginibacter arboris]
MKTIKIFSLTLSLLFLLTNVKAGKPHPHAMYSVKFSITAFIDADTRGICDGLTDIIADNAKFSIIRGDDMWSFNKKQLVDHMESMSGIKQNCTTSWNIVESFNSYVLIKVKMKYPTFSRYNYVTMNECSDGWKITNISSIFIQ